MEHTYEEAIAVVREGVREWCQERGIGVVTVKHERGYLVRVVGKEGSPFEAYTTEHDPEIAVAALIEDLAKRFPDVEREVPGHGE